MYAFWARFRLVLVSFGVHQPLHEVLGTPGVQVFAVVTGERALGMALVFIHLIRIIERVSLGSWEWAVKNNVWCDKSLLKSGLTWGRPAPQNTRPHEIERQVPWVFQLVSERPCLPWEFQNFIRVEYTLFLNPSNRFLTGFFFTEMRLSKSFFN